MKHYRSIPASDLVVGDKTTREDKVIDIHVWENQSLAVLWESWTGRCSTISYNPDDLVHLKPLPEPTTNEVLDAAAQHFADRLSYYKESVRLFKDEPLHGYYQGKVDAFDAARDYILDRKTETT